MEKNHLHTVPPTADEGSGTLFRQFQELINESDSTERDRRRRRHERFVLHLTLQLTPINHAGRVLHDEAVDIVGKDMSVAGIGFSHKNPLLQRGVVISFEHPTVGRLAVEAEVVWTKPTPLGIYESGCRFIRTLAGHKLYCERE